MRCRCPSAKEVSSNLKRIYGHSVKAREKRALNQLSVALSGVMPNQHTRVSQIRTTQALPLNARALPQELTLPPGNPHQRRTAGTRDIGELPHLAYAPRRDVYRPPDQEDQGDPQTEAVRLQHTRRTTSQL